MQSTDAFVMMRGSKREIAEAIRDGIAGAKLQAYAEEIAQENMEVNKQAEYWKDIAIMRRKQVYSSAIRRIEDAEEQVRREMNIMLKGCLIGFAVGVLFVFAFMNIPFGIC